MQFVCRRQTITDLLLTTLCVCQTTSHCSLGCSCTDVHNSLQVHVKQLSGICRGTYTRVILSISWWSNSEDILICKEAEINCKLGKLFQKLNVMFSSTAVTMTYKW